MSDQENNESIADKGGPSQAEPTFVASPSAYFALFPDGIGKILDIAKMIVESIGMPDPKRIEAIGGEQAEQMRQKRGEHAKHNQIRNRLGYRPEPFPLQRVFDKNVNLVAGELVDVAKREFWHVTDHEGIPLKPPSSAGYVDLRLVHRFYKTHNVFVDVLTLALKANKVKPLAKARRSVKAKQTADAAPDVKPVKPARPSRRKGPAKASE